MEMPGVKEAACVRLMCVAIKGQTKHPNGDSLS